MARDVEKAQQMNQDTLDKEIRKYLKKVGITSHQKIEQAVQEAITDGRLQGNEQLAVTMTLEISGIGLSEVITGEIALE
jgi:hypothetical protein